MLKLGKTHLCKSINTRIWVSLSVSLSASSLLVLWFLLALTLDQVSHWTEERFKVFQNVSLTTIFLRALTVFRRIFFPAFFKAITQMAYCAQGLHSPTRVGYELQRLAKLFPWNEIEMTIKRVPWEAINRLYCICMKL